MIEKTTLRDRLEVTKGRPSGFDYMRVALAVLIIVIHSIFSSYGNDDEIWGSAWRAPIALLLPMFFSLSGFLVAGSLERCETLVSFLGLRVLRLGPALAAEVFLSALVLGPLVTELPLREYFSNPELFSYFWNMVGDIHFSLPGVFLHNPSPSIVNGQLWTVPIELKCYVAISIVSIVGLVRRRALFLFAIVALHLFLIWYSIRHPGNAIGSLSDRILVISFLVGILFFQYRDRIRWSAGLFVIALAASLYLMALSFGDRFSTVPVTYVTVYLGLMNPRRSRLLLGGDYSYGLYLYGSPLQQTVAWIGPSLQHWYWNILISLPSAALLAFASWRLLEKPTLGLRPALRRIEQRYLATRETLSQRVILLLRRRGAVS